MQSSPGIESDPSVSGPPKKTTWKEMRDTLVGVFIVAALLALGSYMLKGDSNYSGMYLHTGPVVVNNTPLNDRIALFYLDLRSDHSFIYTIDTGMGYPLDSKITGTWKSEKGYAVLTVSGQERMRFKPEGEDMIAENGNRFRRTN